MKKVIVSAGIYALFMFAAFVGYKVFYRGVAFGDVWVDGLALSVISAVLFEVLERFVIGPVLRKVNPHP